MSLSRALALFLLIVSLTSSSGAKSDGWVEVRSPHFTVVSNAGEKQARTTALRFEEIRAVFRQSITIAGVHPSPPVIVLAVKDEASMRSLLPEFWAKGHSHPSGIFTGRFNLYYALVDLESHGSNPYETLYHEYYHAVTMPLFPDRPVWLSEGLAEYFGHTEIQDKSVSLGEADANLLSLLRERSLIPLKVLFQVDGSSPYYNETNKTSMFYAESWALTHYLMVGDNKAHKPMLEAYTEALNQGRSSIDAAALAFGDLKKLQAELERYIRRSAFLFETVPLSARIGDQQLGVRAISDAEAEAYRAGFTLLRGRAEDARPLLADALKLDTTVALTYQFLSVEEFRAGKEEQALTSMSMAISLDPKNALTRYIRAFLATTGGGAKSKDEQIEQDLREAIAADPDFVPSYSLLAVYLATVNRNLPDALAFAQKAISFEPGNSDYQLALGQVLVRMNKLEEADIAAAHARAWARSADEKANVASFSNFLSETRDRQRQQAEDLADEDVVPAALKPSPALPESPPNGSIATPVNSQASVRLAGAVQMQASISLLSEAYGFNFAPYLKRVMDTVRKNLASSVDRGLVTDQQSLSAEFAVLRDGTMAGLRITSSSGDVALDEATRDGMAACSPLPSLPRTFKGQSLRLHFGLTYIPETTRSTSN